VGFDVIDVTIDVGVLGLISYDGDEGGDLRELFSKLLRCNGDGVRLVHKSKGISSIGFFGIERHVPFPAIEDIILDNMKGERWFVRALDSWFTLPVDILDGCSEISF
jgi:hypothetical protein